MNCIILSQGAAAAINNLMNRDNLNETKAMIADAMILCVFTFKILFNSLKVSFVPNLGICCICVV